jgi:hypothetical protein
LTPASYAKEGFPAPDRISGLSGILIIGKQFSGGLSIIVWTIGLIAV